MMLNKQAYWRLKSTTQHKSQSGQIGLIVLLIMVVILTVGLSITSRSTEQLEISSQQEAATRIFNAAEIGVEQALSGIFSAELAGTLPGLTLTGDTNPSGSDANVKFNITKDQFLETRLNQGSSAEIALNGSAGVLQFDWSKSLCADSPAALLISVYYDDSGTTRAKHYAVDGCAISRGNNFETAISPGVSPYNYQFTMAANPNDILVRVKPVYNNTDLKVSGASVIDLAQFTVIAQAQNTQVGSETKTIEVKRTLQAAPSFMDYVIAGGTSTNNQGVIKN